MVIGGEDNVFHSLVGTSSRSELRCVLADRLLQRVDVKKVWRKALNALRQRGLSCDHSHSGIVGA